MSNNCPNCKSEDIYFNGVNNECITCNYQWFVFFSKSNPEKKEEKEVEKDSIVYDKDFFQTYGF